MSTIEQRQGNSLKEIKSGVASVITMDSFRAAIIDGNAYKIGFADTTGIVSGVSYFYYAKNISATKQVWLRPTTFPKSTIQIKIITNGAFTLGGTAYNPETYIDMTITGTLTATSNVVTGITSTANLRANMEISGIGIPARTYIYSVVDGNTIMLTSLATATGATSIAVSTPKMISRNLNSNYEGINSPSLKVYYQNILGTVVYADSVIDQIYNTVDYEQTDPSKLTETFDVIGPGDTFMAIMTNYGNLKIPYRLSFEWSEV
jgi:hypothetical protein